MFAMIIRCSGKNIVKAESKKFMMSMSSTHFSFVIHHETRPLESSSSTLVVSKTHENTTIANSKTIIIIFLFNFLLELSVACFRGNLTLISLSMVNITINLIVLKIIVLFFISMSKFYKIIN